MADIFPFKAVMPTQEHIQKVASPPYDVMSSAEAAEMAKGNPFSFLHVSRPEIDLPEGTDLHSDEVYAKAAENYNSLKQQGVLVQDSAPVFYVYSLIMNGKRQTGIVAAASVDDYDNNVILKHEKTRPDKEDDRTRHIRTLSSQTGPVFLTYRASAEIDRVIEAITSDMPVFDLTADDGVRHTVWRTPEQLNDKIQLEFSNIPKLYIADGHHRAAAASRSRAAGKAENPDHTGLEEYNRFLTVIFPDNQMQILAYNRFIKDLNKLSEDKLIQAVSKSFKISDTDTPVPQNPGQVCMYLNSKWSLLEYKGDISSLPPAEQLDVSVLQDNLLNPVLGINDPRTDNRIEFIGGIRGTAELERRVNNEGGVAFSMHPTTIEQLMAISDAGEIMPPKSTWFEPKLRDALLIHDI